MSGDQTLRGAATTRARAERVSTADMIRIYTALQRYDALPRCGPSEPGRHQSRTYSISTRRALSAMCRRMSAQPQVWIERECDLERAQVVLRDIASAGSAKADVMCRPMRRAFAGELRPVLELRGAAFGVPQCGPRVFARRQVAHVPDRIERWRECPSREVRRHSSARASAPAQDGIPNDSPPSRKRERSEPEQQRRRLDGRLVQHEIAVARDQVLLDLGVASCPVSASSRTSRRKSSGQRRGGIGQRLVLADEAAQFLLEILEPRLEGGVGLRVRTRPRRTGCQQPAARRMRLTTSATRAPAAGSLLSGSPGDRSDLLVTDHAGLVDDEGFRYAIDAPVDSDAAVRIHDGHLVRVAVLREPRTAEVVRCPCS